MLDLLDRKPETVVATDAEAKIAREAAEMLRVVAQARRDIDIVVQDGAKPVVSLPAAAVDMMYRILLAMGDQVPMALVPVASELTTQQAADFLNVSRPFLIRLLEEGKIPFRKVGRHRRVRYADLRAYDEQSKREQRKAIEAMAALSRDMNLD